MADLQNIRAALAANLGRVDLSPYTGVQITAYPPAVAVPPVICVAGVDTVEYDESMQRGHDLWTVVVQAYVGSPSEQTYRIVDRMLASTGSASVKTAIEYDRTLAGACKDLIVTESSGHQIYTVENVGPVVGADWRITVAA